MGGQCYQHQFRHSVTTVKSCHSYNGFKKQTGCCKCLHESYSLTSREIQMSGAKNVCGKGLCSRCLGFVSDSDRRNRHEHGNPFEMYKAFFSPILTKYQFKKHTIALKDIKSVAFYCYKIQIFLNHKICQMFDGESR